MASWTETTNAPQAEVIRASEVGTYTYCARAWWLGSVEGVNPEDTRRLRAGQAVHARHGQRVVLSAALMRLGYLLLLLAGLMGAGWALRLLVG
jgi:CRISPR/Cas system-associated exonuclease Cas4 (RecB family)